MGKYIMILKKSKDVLIIMFLVAASTLVMLSQARAAGPDLVTAAITRLPNTPMAGQSVSFNVYTQNIGDQAAGSSQTVIRIDQNADGSYETEIGQLVGAISAGGSETTNFVWTPTAPGNYQMQACADSLNTVAETNESNNCLSQTFTVDPASGTTPPPGGGGGGGSGGGSSASKPVADGGSAVYAPIHHGIDLTVSSIVFTPPQPIRYAKNSITVNIQNIGTAPAYPSQVRLRIDQGNDGSFEQTATNAVPAIPSAATESINFDWTPTAGGDYRIEACADSEGTMSEYDENNNCTTVIVGIPGDPIDNKPGITLSITPTKIAPGENVIVVWNTHNADFCNGSGNLDFNLPLYGKLIYTPTADSSYILTCNNQYGANTASVKVTLDSKVNNRPEISIDSSLAQINAGESVNLTWSSDKAISCVASGGWSGAKLTSGSETVSPTSDTTYTITCKNNYGSTAASKLISVKQMGRGPVQMVAACIANPSTVAVNKEIIFAADASGGKKPFTFKWEGAVNGTGNTQIISFAEVGTKIAKVQIIDADGKTASASCQVKVTAYQPPKPVETSTVTVGPVSTTTSKELPPASLTPAEKVSENVKQAGSSLLASIGFVARWTWRILLWFILLIIILFVLLLIYRYLQVKKPHKKIYNFYQNKKNRVVMVYKNRKDRKKPPYPPFSM